MLHVSEPKPRFTSSQRALVLVAGLRQVQDRRMAAAVQREPYSHYPGVADASVICRGSGREIRQVKPDSHLPRVRSRVTVNRYRRDQ